MPDTDETLIVPRPPLGDEGRMVAVVARMPTPVFAVVDGGHFDDAAAALEAAGLGARSLFLGDATRDVQRHGPWLVPLAGAATADVLRVTAGKPAPVFWSCSAGEGALHRHLRTLNQALIPAWAARGAAGSETAADERAELALFRHLDPNVLGGLLPLLDADQFVRVFGPADELAFDTPDHGGLKRAMPVEGVAPHGPLQLRTEQMLALAGRRQAASDRRVAQFLRGAVPDETAQHTDAQLAAEVVRLRQSSVAMGLREEPAQAWWAYLMLSTGGEIGQNARVTGYLARGTVPATADARMTRLRDGVVLLAHSDKPVA